MCERKHEIVRSKLRVDDNQLKGPCLVSCVQATQTAGTETRPVLLSTDSFLSKILYYWSTHPPKKKKSHLIDTASPSHLSLIFFVMFFGGSWPAGSMSAQVLHQALNILLIGHIVSGGSSVREVISQRWPLEDSYNFSGRLVFESVSTSVTACAVMCVTHDVCMTFSFAPVSSKESGFCRGFAEIPADDVVVVQAARLYSVNRSVASGVTMAGSGQLMTTSGALALGSSTDESSLEENIQTSVGLHSTFTTSSSRQSTSARTYRPWNSKDNDGDKGR